MRMPTPKNRAELLSILKTCIGECTMQTHPDSSDLVCQETTADWTMGDGVECLKPAFGLSTMDTSSVMYMNSLFYNGKFKHPGPATQPLTHTPQPKSSTWISGRGMSRACSI